jgi:starch synthase
VNESVEQAPLKVLFCSAEVAPFVKVGGLADVAGALPKALRALGHDLRVILPAYRQINREKWGVRPAGLPPIAVPGAGAPAGLSEAVESGVPVYLVENEEYFGRDAVYGFPDDPERFSYFCRAALGVLEAIGWMPDVVQCNDWHTAIIPRWLHERADLSAGLKKAASLLTIHNLAYQGDFDPAELELPWLDRASLQASPDGTFDFMTQGIYGADIINTVSETYAQEITTPSYGEGLDTLLRDRANQLRGILNGIDDQRFDPATDPDIAANYTADTLQGKAACKAALQQEVGFDLNPRTPLIGLIGRLVDQKGFDLVAQILEPLTAEVNLQVVILGTGEPKYHDLVRELAAHNRRQIAAYLTFDEALAQRIYAGCDLFLMPSRFEPCGLGQMIALRYGTVPIVRSTGGLADTVTDYQPMTDRGTGFVFRRYDATALTFALGRALEVYRQPDRWRSLQQQGMAQDFSWDASARKYVDIYREAQTIHGTGR